MKITLAAAISAVTIAALSLTACGGGRSDDTATEKNPAGLPADATVGVSLPWLGTQNWKESETMLDEQLTDAGFTPIIQSADNKVPQQQQQIETMIEQGAKVIIVGAIDSTQLGPVLENARDADVTVIALAREIENTAAVDGVVQFGATRMGELQGQSLLDGLAELKGEPPYNIELFAGGPADPNAPLIFDGALSVLQPKISDGTLNIVSRQTDFTQAATPDWDNAKAQTRMDSLLSGFYSDAQIDGVLSPNDGIARAILTAVGNTAQDLPVVTGLDAENESVVSIWEGKQYSTVYQPTDRLVAKTVEIITELQSTGTLPQADRTEDNGATNVPVFQLDPEIVTRANMKQVFANDPTRLALIGG